MIGWVIVVPVWHARYVNLFKRNGLPSLKAALARATLPVRFIVATDCQQEFPSSLFHPYPVTLRDVRDPSSGKYNAFGNAHRAAIDEALPGEIIGLFPADIVVSIEIFEACEKHFLAGKKAVAYAGMRSAEGNPPPLDATAAELTQWCMNNRHQWIKDCFWGSGGSLDPAYIFFQKDNDILLHAWTFGPLAVLKDRALTFEYTIDVNLLACYQRHEVHLVTDMAELAATDISSPEQVFPVGEPMTVDSVAHYVKRIGLTPMHRWFFEQAIRVTGNPDPNLGRKEVTDILAKWSLLEQWDADLKKMRF